MVFGALVVVFGVLGAVVAAYLFSTRSPARHEITATPPLPSRVAITPTPTANLFRLGEVTFSADGLYAFPVAADPRQYTWTHYHWDGSNAVDIEARAGLDEHDFRLLTGAELVACAGGVVYEWSGDVGGTGYILQGDDNLDYYYAHMSELYLPDGMRVEAGTPLGRMGNTGGTAQFIEPHLHFAIGPRGTLQTPAPLVINAAEWLLIHFGLNWEERDTTAPPPAQPAGWPAPHPQVEIVTPYAQAVAQGLPQPAIEFGWQGDPPPMPVHVVAPLTGRANVIRWTDQYGTRIQINNELSRVTVVISGVSTWSVQDGDLVNQGQLIGYWNPAQRPTLHYMLYRDSDISDPTGTLNTP